MRSLYELCDGMFDSWLVIAIGMSRAVKMFKRENVVSTLFLMFYVYDLYQL